MNFKISSNYLLLIVLVSFVIFFSHLDVIYVNIMEARNFITAREMLNYDNWFLTTMNLEPRYEKPPLPTWLTAFSGALFGMKSLTALRLPAALSALTLILFCYFFSYDLLKDKKRAFINTLILATSFYVIFAGRNGTWDIYTHSFMLGGIWFLFKFFESSSQKWKNSFLAALFIGCSFMSKGPVSLYALLLPFLIAYGIVFKYKGFKAKWGALITAILFILIISAWWPVYIYLFDSSSVQAIADKETVAWTNRHVRPWYHYWSFTTQSGIWTIPAFISLIYPYMIKRVKNKKVYRLSFFWTMTAVVLLSLIPEKKERYLFPVLIPLAINTGFYIEFLISKGKQLTLKKDLYPAYFNFGLIGLIGISFPIGGYIFMKDQLSTLWVYFILTAITLFAIGISMIIVLRKKSFEKAFYLTILFMGSILLFGFPLSKSFFSNDTYANINELHEIEKNKQIKVYSIGTITPELLWEYDGTLKNIYKGNSLTYPKEHKFGILVQKEMKQEILRKFNSDYKTNLITRFDINFVGQNKKGYKSRLVRELYLVEKQ